MQLRHDPTYYWATRRLPRDLRPAVHALYGFVRGADEIVDGRSRASSPEARRAALERWHSDLRHGLSRGDSGHPVIAALVDAGGRHRLPLDELEIYMSSMAVDCGPVRIETREELDRYMRGSAGAVGHIMAALLDAPDEARHAFGRLGVAFQLTNFIRDVREDWELDRIYLPREERERFGVAEEEIARRETTPAFRALIAAEVGRARSLFSEGAPAIAAVTPRLRPGMRIAHAVYLRVLDRIEAIGFDVLCRRTAPSPVSVAAATLGALRARA